MDFTSRCQIDDVLEEMKDAQVLKYWSFKLSEFNDFEFILVLIQSTNAFQVVTKNV